MKKALVCGVGALSLIVAAPAAADGEEHNCAGAVTSSLAGPGFGQAVSFFAQQQAVDNFGLANCGEAQGENP